ncbi:unnamed protein product, partial [Musa acuminata subsp. burmannicoides]
LSLSPQSHNQNHAKHKRRGAFSTARWAAKMGSAYSTRSPSNPSISATEAQNSKEKDGENHGGRENFSTPTAHRQQRPRQRRRRRRRKHPGSDRNPKFLMVSFPPRDNKAD